jgi:hypothetical protein
VDSGEELDDLRTDVLRAAMQVNGRCPLCAIGRASSIDHYLPRRVYPEFAILAENLTPACERCNRLKGDVCVDSGDAPFFHPYLDNVPNERLLLADVEVARSVAVRYTVSDSANDSLTLAKLRHHFERFDLGSHYRQEAVIELGNTALAFSWVHASRGPELLQELLIQERDRRTAERGINQWDVALYSALADEPAFFDGGFAQLLS